MVSRIDKTAGLSVTAGTIDFVITGSAFNSLNPVSNLTNGNEYDYLATYSDGVTTGWEVGRGTWISASNTLSRDTIFNSSAVGAKINFSGASLTIEIVVSSNQYDNFFIRDETLTDIGVPANDDKILVQDTDGADALKHFIVGKIRYRIATTNLADQYEDLSGLVNDSNTVFTVPGGVYADGSLIVLHGTAKAAVVVPGVQVTTPASGIFTLPFVPLTTGPDGTDIVMAFFHA